MQFDPDTIARLKAVLEDSWEALSPNQQAETSRAVLAERILKIAARGERDHFRLPGRTLAGFPTQEAK
jgi:hypothetical protein